MNGAAAYAANEVICRDQLFEDNLLLVKRIAHHLAMRLPSGQSVDDLIQVGMIGLLEASRSYESAQGASFQTYAGIRIRGAMLDELRRQTWVPRSVHQKARKISNAIHAVEARLSRSATDREIAEELGESLDNYHDSLQKVSGSQLFSLDSDDSALEPEDNNSSPFGDLEDSDMRQKLAEVIAGLPEREKMVMALYYDEELNLREIGEVMDIGESRVCQIHSQAINRVRSRMQEWI